MLEPAWVKWMIPMMDGIGILMKQHSCMAITMDSLREEHHVFVGVSLEVVQASAEVQLPVPSAP